MASKKPSLGLNIHSNCFFDSLDKFSELKCTRKQFIPLNVFIEPEDVPEDRIIGADALSISQVVGDISHVHFEENAYGTFVEIRQGQDLNQTKLLFIGYDFLNKLEVTYYLQDDAIFPENTMLTPKGKKNTKGVFINLKKAVFYVLQTDVSSQIDLMLQNRIVKLRVYYANVFLGQLSMTLVAELDLSQFISVARLEILGIHSLVEEKSILIELSPERDEKGAIVRNSRIFDDFKIQMLKRLGLGLENLLNKNTVLKIALLDLITHTPVSSSKKLVEELIDLKYYDLMNSVSRLQTNISSTKQETNENVGKDQLLAYFKARTDLRILSILDKLVVYSSSPSAFIGYIKIQRRFQGNFYSTRPEMEEMG